MSPAKFAKASRSCACRVVWHLHGRRPARAVVRTFEAKPAVPARRAHIQVCTNRYSTYFDERRVLVFAKRYRKRSARAVNNLYVPFLRKLVVAEPMVVVGSMRRNTKGNDTDTAR